MIWWIVFVLTAVVSLGECERCNLVNYRKDEFDKLSCNVEKTKNEQGIEDKESCDTRRMFPKIYVIDSKQGKVAVEFRLLNNSCNITEYELKLSEIPLILTQQTENACARYSKEKTITILQNDTVRSCGKVFNVTFENVRKGNYTLAYSFKNDSKTPARELQNRTDINTNYYEKKNNCLSSITCITPHPSEGDDISFTVIVFSKINKAQFSVIKDPVTDNGSECTNFADGYRWYTSRDVNKTFMCKMDELHEKDSTRWVECSEDDDGVICTLHNFSAGNYCFAVAVKEPCACERGFCNNLYQYFNISEKLSFLPFKPLPETSMYIGLIATLVILLLFSFIIFIALWWRRREVPIPGPYFRENRPLPQTSRILLLYARDCEPFMKTMVTFREMLKEIPDCKVYDCFDTNLVEDICRSKVDWIQHHISLNDMKILVIESACVLQHQEALLHHNKICYNQPTWLDDLFLYGLKALINDIGRNMYQSVFVIRIDGFTEEKEFLKNLSPYTRYIIPQHLETLIADLHLKGKLNIHDDAINEKLQNLQQNINNLVNYKKQNPNYLNKLLST